MPLIESPNPKPRRTKITLRLDEPLARTVHRYGEFIRATNEYVIAQALNYFFERDLEFKQWLVSNPNASPRTRSRGSPGNNAAGKKSGQQASGQIVEGGSAK